MRKTRAALAMLQGQTADWLHSPRTVISSLVVLALTYMNARSFAFTLENNAHYAYFGETVFYYLSSGFGNAALVSALFLIMVAEIPRRTAFQNVMLIRATRTRWLFSQVLFCLMVTLLMILSMLLLSMLLTLPYLSAGSGWSDLDRIAANPDAAYGIQFAPEYVRSMAPWQACLIAGGILFVFWISMVLVILFCSVSGRPNLGLVLYTFILILHITVLWEELPAWIRYIMPIHYATMTSAASLFFGHELETMPKIIVSYLGADILFIILLRMKISRMDLFFAGKDGYK